MASDYLEIEKVRFGDGMKYSIDVPEELMRVQVPPFCLQTLVENSVKYGGGDIRVYAQAANGRLLLQVWDSGNGFPPDVALPVGHGLRNLTDRLEALWGQRATLDVRYGESGTTVEISLPASLS